MLSSPVQLSYFPKRTHARMRKALAYFGSCDAILAATSQELITCGWDADTVEYFVTWRGQYDSARIAEHLASLDISTITIEDDTYPPQLRHLHDPPLCLFIRGDFSRYTTSIAVVGSRKMSSYGKLVIDTLIPELVRAGVTIVSGLAYGVDSAAHQATLHAAGTTHAVLGSGVDTMSIAPRNHVRLADDIIAAGGSLISEYPPGTEATRYTFPERNRIMAALTKATLVVEAGAKSGSLITASCAMDIGRDVCAVPHPIHTPNGEGPNTLIKHGAHTITSATDLLTLLDIAPKTQSQSTQLPTSRVEQQIYTLLQTEAKHIDEIIALLRLDGTSVMSTISIMEMRGLIRNTGSMMYIAV